MFPAASTSAAPYASLGALGATNAQHPALGGGPSAAAGTAGKAGTNINSSSSSGGGGSGEDITATESQQLLCLREETEGNADHLLQDAAEPRHALLPRGALNSKHARLGARSTLLPLFWPMAAPATMFHARFFFLLLLLLLRLLCTRLRVGC
jgi:hypothetical protein